jgi:hypothetical protein
MTQSSWPVAVRHALVAAQIVEAFLIHQSSADPLADVKHAIKGQFPEIYQEFIVIERELETPHTQAVGMVFGRPCYNPGTVENRVTGKCPMFSQRWARGIANFFFSSANFFLIR